MGKKTLKAKMKADHKKYVVEPPLEHFSFKDIELTSSTIDPRVNTKPNKSDSLYVYPVQYIRHDLTKTLILCILAISLELALFVMLEGKIVLPFGLKL